ncbi:hypothetical protein EG328_010279 [Venturia inaequalis]|uniref:Uncharacterized protein n=1 Tax=Venturia inaequalis TaxID=5025 RepID=A0A8H3U7X6_VENIN|nr:hypothetical protein EG328_010279 [Venturia inaequalis]KAE9971918.1 hypothetical protein EG327_009679 [Venturia inaequalis]
MQFQTSLLLPALLFAQSSLAYYCCFEITNNGGNNRISTLVDSGIIVDDKGNIDNWYPKPDCKIEITKKGTGCGNWAWRIADSRCKSLVPIFSLGVAEYSHCS